MSKKLISLLLSLVLIVGTVAVPGRAAPGDTIKVILHANNGTFKSPNPSTGIYADQRYITLTEDAHGNYSYEKLDETSKMISRPNYDFAGWFATQSSSGGNPIIDGSLVTTKAEHTLYARWTIKTISVTLELNGGNISGSTANRTITIPYGATYKSELSKLSVKKDGATLEGWTTSSGDFDTNTIASGTTATTLTAKWTDESYTVTLDPCGGTGLTTTSFAIKYNQAYSDVGSTALSQTPTLTGYNFGGWYTQRDGRGDKIESSTNTPYTLVSNQMLYAKWEAKNIDVTFNYNYPTDITPTPTPATETKSVTYDKSYGTALATPKPSTLEGGSGDAAYKYTFDGWYEEAEDKPETDTTEAVVYNKVVSTDLVKSETPFTLYARWKYDVQLDPDGGTVAPEKKELTTGKAVGSLPTPKKDGYEFLGWYTQETPADTDSPITDETIADSTKAPYKKFYAKWEPKTYTVTLDPNGGEFADKVNDKIDVTYNEQYGNLPGKDEVTKIGYELENWYKTKEPVTGEKPVKTDSVVDEFDTHTLYARWKPTKYKVNLKYNVPTLDEPYDPTIKDIGDIAIDSPLAGLPTSNNVKGYEYKDTTFTFYNWYTKDGAMVNSGSTLTPNMLDNGSVTLSARWKYNVTFYNNTTSSTNPGPGTQLPFITGAKYEDENKFPTPTNTGKTLVGWFTEPVDGTQVLPSAEADGETTKLYAHWTTSEYVVTLDANGGEFRKDQNVKSWQYTYGDTYGNNVTDKNYVPAPPAGHTFIGWYTEKEGGSKVSATEKVTKTCTLYAHWKADQFKVTLDLGYDSKSSVHTVDYDTELSKVLPSPEPDRTGYAFEGWFEDKAFTKPADTKLKIQADITLYAKWKEAKRVSLDVGGGKLPENTPAYINVYEGGTYMKLPTPTWPGSIFKGWWTTPKTGGKQVKPSDTVPAPSSIPVTLYARWESKKITVYLDYNGAPGEAGRTITCSVGDTYKSLPTYLSWAGHEFMGWYTKETGGEKVEKTTIVSVPSDDVEELTLFAHWGYTVVFEPGDGSGTMDKVAAEMDQPYTLPECTFTAPDGMRFGGWAIGSPDAPTQPAGSQYTVVRNLALYATWTDKPITITVTCTSGGSLATDDGKTNTVTAERGTDVTFIARPNAGYELKDLQVDGVSYNYTVEYTFRRIEEDHKIHAVFGRIDAPSYSSCDHGTNCPLSGYRDLNSNAWYHDAVHFCMDNVIMGGSNNSFKPNAKATRAEVATSLWSAEGREPVSGNGPLSKTYPDVAVSDWYYQPIEWATRRGILAGYSNGRFGPNDSITREQLVSVLWRHAGSPKPRSTVLRFNDASKVSGFAWDAMLWATEKGIISGRPGGYLAPKGNATRADVAQVLKNYLN